MENYLSNVRQTSPHIFHFLGSKTDFGTPFALGITALPRFMVLSLSFIVKQALIKNLVFLQLILQILHPLYLLHACANIGILADPLTINNHYL